MVFERKIFEIFINGGENVGQGRIHKNKEQKTHSANLINFG